MLHGLMLPSGNDAALCLAENFGEYLYEISLMRTVSKDGEKADQLEKETEVKKPAIIGGEER
jgi:hypothetical protein